MLACPNCSQRLARRVTDKGVLYACPGCGGVAAGLATLRNEHVARESIGRVWQTARQEAVPQGRPCPHCGRRMAVVPADAGDHKVELDVCRNCACVWFDPGERATLPQAPPPPPTKPEDPDLSPEAREAVAMERVDETRRRLDEIDSESGPEMTWQYLPAMFGLPVECGVPAVRTRPWVTWGAAALCVVVFVGAAVAGGAGGLERMIRMWGFVPAEWYRLAGATFVTGFFLHAGVWHLVGNVYFLVVFGDNVEDQLGWRRYALLLLLADLAGTVLHAVLDPRSAVPLVGASAGISGVIAYYAVAFPRARLGFYLFPRLLFRWFRMPVWGAFLVWVGFQWFGVFAQLWGGSGVSALGHLGGAAVGLVAALIVRRRRREALDFAGVRRASYERTSASIRQRKPYVHQEEDVQEEGE
ncbi:MAG: rhomboid family intramembrane serine protease [Planctomycetota bacterium]|jgi:membrane associated rhomboid family serine protease